MRDDINQFINKYKDLANIHYQIDYSNKTSVQRGNKAVEDMIIIAKQIFTEYSYLQYEFIKLLDHETAKVDLWAAHHLLECSDNIDKENIKKALNVIKKYSKKSGPEALGEKLWLKEWKRKH